MFELTVDGLDQAVQYLMVRGGASLMGAMP